MSQRTIIDNRPRAKARALPFHPMLAGLIFLSLVLALVLGATLARAAEPAGDEVTYPVSDFADGKARHFSLKSPEGITVRYFLLKAQDGSMRAAFDACDVCWRSNKGFFQEGGNMVCKNCGRRFASVQVGQIRGGCNPGPLALSVQGDQVRIKKADIFEGQHYFDFNKR
jgi:uncharacterized membrane protein